MDGGSLLERATIGSHDAGTFGITTSSPYTSDAPDFVGKIQNIPGVGSIMKTATRDWAVTQDRNFVGQIVHCESRYLDLRIEYSDQWWIIHSLRSISLAECARQISKALDSISDVVVIHVQKAIAANGQPVTPNMIGEFILKFVNVLGARVVDQHRFTMHTPVVTMVSQGQKAFISTPWEKNDHWVNNDESIDNPWANAQNVVELQGKLQSYVAAAASTAPKTKLFVLQAIITPDTDMIVNGIETTLGLRKAEQILSFGAAGGNTPTSLSQEVRSHAKDIRSAVGKIASRLVDPSVMPVKGVGVVNVVMVDFVGCYNDDPMHPITNALGGEQRRTVLASGQWKLGFVPTLMQSILLLNGLVQDTNPMEVLGEAYNSESVHHDRAYFDKHPDEQKQYVAIVQAAQARIGQMNAKASGRLANYANGLNGSDAV